MDIGKQKLIVIKSAETMDYSKQTKDICYKKNTVIRMTITIKSLTLIENSFLVVLVV